MASKDILVNSNSIECHVCLIDVDCSESYQRKFWTSISRWWNIPTCFWCFLSISDRNSRRCEHLRQLKSKSTQCTYLRVLFIHRVLRRIHPNQFHLARMSLLAWLHLFILLFVLLPVVQHVEKFSVRLPSISADLIFDSSGLLRTTEWKFHPTDQLFIEYSR